MQKTEFIAALAVKASITEEQAAQVNEILELHPAAGKNGRSAAAAEIAERLGTELNEAEEIANAASAVIADNIKYKLLHPFGGNEEDK